MQYGGMPSMTEKYVLGNVLKAYLQCPYAEINCHKALFFLFKAHCKRESNDYVLYAALRARWHCWHTSDFHKISLF